jgi:hypothetical protein
MKILIVGASGMLAKQEITFDKWLTIKGQEQERS